MKNSQMRSGVLQGISADPFKTLLFHLLQPLYYGHAGAPYCLSFKTVNCIISIIYSTPRARGRKQTNTDCQNGVGV